MEFQYTINDIKSKTNVSLQSLYNLIKKNQDFINENSTRKQRKVFYNQTAMDFFIDYYHPEQAHKEGKNEVSEEILSSKATQAEISPLESSPTDNPYKSQIDALQAEITALKGEITTLRKQLDEKEIERKELIQQNGALILTLQQEKQEKQLFLPAPKKSFAERLKGIFKGN